MGIEPQDKMYAVINLGSSYITGMLATKLGNGVISPKTYRSKPSRGSIIHGRIHNIHQSAEIIAELLTELEAELPEGEHIARVYVGLDCRSMQSKPFTASVRLSGSAGTIEESHLRQLREQARQASFADYEVVRIIDPRYYVDGKHETTPRGVRGTHIEAKYQLIIVRRAVVENIREVFEHKLKLSIQDILIAPLTEASLTLSSEESILGCIYVNIGGGTTSISVYEGRLLTALYTIPLGGINVTRDLTHLGLLEDQAERLKLQYGSMRTNVPTSELIDPMAFKLDRQLSQLEVNRYISARMIEIIGSTFSVISQSPAARHETMTLIFGGGVSSTEGFIQTIRQEFRGAKIRQGFVRREFVSEAFDTELIPEYSTALSLVHYATENCVDRVASLEEVFSHEALSSAEHAEPIEPTEEEHEEYSLPEVPQEQSYEPMSYGEDELDEEDYEDEDDDEGEDDTPRRGFNLRDFWSETSRRFGSMFDKLNAGGN